MKKFKNYFKILIVLNTILGTLLFFMGWFYWSNPDREIVNIKEHINDSEFYFTLLFSFLVSFLINYLISKKINLKKE